MRNAKNGQTIHIEITIKGSISPEMEGWFEGLSVESAEGNTIISGTLPDQQALFGLVNLLRNLGVSILSINMHPANE
jgi:hypothetical protein